MGPGPKEPSPSAPNSPPPTLAHLPAIAFPTPPPPSLTTNHLSSLYSSPSPFEQVTAASPRLRGTS